MVINSDPHDGVAAAQRARSSYTPNWHPIIAAVEIEPGHWELRDQYERPYGVIRFLRRGDQLGYRAVTWAEASADRRLIGYYRTLRAACAATHVRFVRAHGQPGAVNGR